jgi:hypothetical protein
MSDTVSPVSISDARLNELLTDGLIHADRCYGTGEKLCLDADAGAVYVGCSKHALYRAEERGELKPIPQESKSAFCRVDRIRSYTLRQLRVLRERRLQDNGDGTYSTKGGKRVSLRKVAKSAGMPYRSLLQELGVRESDGQKPPEPDRQESYKPNRLGILNLNPPIKPVRMRPAFGGKQEWTILEDEAVCIRWAINTKLKEKRPKGFLQSSEIAERLQLPCSSQRRQLGACLKLWVEKNMLKSATILLLMPGKVTTRKDKRVLTVNKLYCRTIYDGDRAVKLWNNLDTTTAAKKLRALLEEGPRAVADVHKEMHKAGFPDHLIYQAARAIKAVRHISSFRGPQTYELRKSPRKNALAVLRDILGKSPALVSVVKHRLQAEGWSFHSPAVKKAAANLEVKKIPAPGRKWWWCLPGQHPPLIPSPSVKLAIDFVESYLVDGKPRLLQAIIAAAAERGIKKQRLIDAVPFLSNVQRDRDPKGKRRFSTWRLIKAVKTDNGEIGQSHEAEPETERAPKRRGRPKGAVGKKAAKRRADLLRRWDAGEFTDSVSAAAKAFRMDRTTVYKILKKARRLC